MLTYVDVANVTCLLQLQFCFQLPAPVLRAAEPGAGAFFKQQVLCWVPGILPPQKTGNRGKKKGK